MVQQLAAGTRLVGRGDPKPCHGVVRFGWAAVGPGEAVVATGTNVAGADLDGRFRWVTGFWDPGPARTATAPLTSRSGRVGRSPRSSPAKCGKSPSIRAGFCTLAANAAISADIRWSQVGPALRGAYDPRARRPATSGRNSYGQRASIG
jgi:hypothetical protein